jgi:hypothetical protein
MKLRFMLIASICLALTSCRDSGGPANPTHISVTASGVRLASSKVEAGKATDAQLKQGLQSAADALSMVYAEARKTHAQLKGHLRGTFHIESDGTPRMFAERNSEFTPAEGKDVSDQFIAATFGGKWRFPRIDGDLMLTVDFELDPGR